MEVNCVLLSTYTFIIPWYMTFMPFYMNYSTAQVTHFSSTLIFRLDILTIHYFFTSFYLMMINGFLNDTYTLHVLYQQLHMEVNCVLLSTYTFILHLYMTFMPFYMNYGTAQVTHFPLLLYLD